jgi:lactam utilization protein B
LSTAARRVKADLNAAGEGSASLARHALFPGREKRGGPDARGATGCRSIDLNSDLGEGFGAYTCGDDAAMLDIVTSANVACGFHAGDPDIMARDLSAGEGDRSVAMSAPIRAFAISKASAVAAFALNSGEIERMVAYQIGAAQALAVYAGHRISPM